MKPLTIGTRALGEFDVAKIRQRRDDSLKNGAIIGAVAGAAYFLTVVALLADSDGGERIAGTAVARRNLGKVLISPGTNFSGILSPASRAPPCPREGLSPSDSSFRASSTSMNSFGPSERTPGPSGG
jgi:hypothetical protein